MRASENRFFSCKRASKNGNFYFSCNFRLRTRLGRIFEIWARLGHAGRGLREKKEHGAERDVLGPAEGALCRDLLGLPSHVGGILWPHQDVEQAAVLARLHDDRVREHASDEDGLAREREDLAEEGLDLRARPLRTTFRQKLDEPALERYLHYMVVCEGSRVVPVLQGRAQELVVLRLDLAGLAPEGGDVRRHVGQARLCCDTVALIRVVF